MSEVALLNSKSAVAMESALIDGDLSKFTAEQRVVYYKNVCESLGLNYLTKPFAYIKLNGKLTLYALKDCTEQLRQRDGVSIRDIRTQSLDGVFIVTAYATSKDGKEDVATGAVPTLNLKGEALANAFMKAETKAKRRVTLSICGLGWADESEVASIPNAKTVDVNFETGEIVYDAKAALELPIMGQASAPYTIEQAIAELTNCTDMTTLAGTFQRASPIFRHLPEELKHLITAKDKRKEQLTEAELIKMDIVELHDSVDGA